MKRVSRLSLFVALLLTSDTIRGATQDATAPASDRTATDELMAVPEPDIGTLAAPVAQRVRAALEKLRLAEAEDATAEAERGRLFGRAGQLFYANALSSAAEACLHNATLLDPKEPRWPYLLGALLQGLGRSQEAVDAYESTLARTPDQPQVRYRLVSTLLDLGRLDEAEASLAAAARAADLPVGFAELAARLAAARGKTEEAIRRYEEALRLAPQATRLHFPLATLYRQLGKTEEADRHARQAGSGEVPIPDPWLTEVADHAAGPQGLVHRGLRAQSDGDLEEAERALRKAVELAPSNPQAHQNLGAVLLSRGALTEAERHLHEALRLRPDYPEAHYNLARVAEERGDTRRALDHYARMAELATHWPKYRLPYVRLLLAARRPAQAVRELEAVVRDAPASLEARFLFVVALEATGERRQAQEEAVAALRVAPEAPELIELYVRLTATTDGLAEGERQQALTAARRLYEEQNRSPSSADALAMALAANGRFEEAVDLQQALVEGFPGSAPEPTLQHLRRNLDQIGRAHV